MKKVVLAAFLTIIATVTPLSAGAQEESYKFDAGVSLGMSGYLGDANESNLFKHPGLAAGLSFRYLANTRWAIRGLFTTASLSGNTADFNYILPDGKHYDFKSRIYDLGARVEFNFFAYGIGETYKKLRRCSPYLSLGVGATMSSSDGNSAFAMNVPMGFGVKYKLKPRINLGAEFTMTKVFGDNVDSKELTDLYRIKSSALKNTDWYSTIMFSITYEFGKRCTTCHYVE